MILKWFIMKSYLTFYLGRARPGPLNLANARKNELPLQKLLFTATLAQDPENLEKINLFEPKLFRYTEYMLRSFIYVTNAYIMHAYFNLYNWP